MKLNLLLCLFYIAGIFGVISTANAQYVPTNGLVAYYPFSGNANDSSANGYDMTVSGATLVADRFGRPNHAYSFDGVNDLISYNTTLPVTNQFTWSFWVWVDTQQNCALLYNGNTNSNGYGFCINSGLNPGSGSWGSNITFMSGGINYNMSVPFQQLFHKKWGHIVLTRDNNKYKLYLNSILTDSSTNTFNPVNGRFHAGLDYTDNTNDYKGALDDIGIFNRVLTQDEIDSLYYGCGGQFAGPIQDASVTSGDTALILANAYPSMDMYQWQADTGTGYFDLMDGIQFGGTATGELSVYNADSSYSSWQFRVVVRDDIFCPDTSEAAQILFVPTNINEVNGYVANLTVYPNPAGSHFTIDLTAIRHAKTISIIDMSGRKVYHAVAEGGTRQPVLTNVASGTYLLYIADEQDRKIGVTRLIIN